MIPIFLTYGMSVTLMKFIQCPDREGGSHSRVFLFILLIVLMSSHDAPPDSADIVTSGFLLIYVFWVTTLCELSVVWFEFFSGL